jgi:hypothetical protein
VTWRRGKVLYLWGLTLWMRWSRVASRRGGGDKSVGGAGVVVWFGGKKEVKEIGVVKG